MLLLVGCNQLYGLDETIGPEPPVPVDSDKDGVADEDDNCVLVSNVDQANDDGDTFGDACDPCVKGPQSGIDDDSDGIDDLCDACPLGSNHNEDTDSFLDGCDNCPGVTNEDQADIDLDGVGEACDHSTAIDRRTFFEAFAPPDPMWNSGFAMWQSTGEGYGPSTIPAIGGGAWHPHAKLGGGAWQVTTLIQLPTNPPNGATIGMTLLRDAGTNAGLDCTVYYMNGQWLEVQSDTVITVTNPLPITMMSEQVDMFTTRPLCLIGTQKLTRSTSPAPAPGYYPLLFADNCLPEYLNIDVVQP